nr:uncharacterized protein LOC114824203 [Malus domestica]
MAGLFLSDFINVQHVITYCPLLFPSRWIPPPPNWIKINVDAFFCANSKCKGIGVVFHNKAGSYTGGFVCKTPNTTNPNTSKILAAHEGLHLAIQRQWQHIVLECDALQVVQVIGSPSCGLSTTGLLIEDVKTSLQSYMFVKVSHNVDPPI